MQVLILKDFKVGCQLAGGVRRTCWRTQGSEALLSLRRPHLLLRHIMSPPPAFLAFYLPFFCACPVSPST